MSGSEVIRNMAINMERILCMVILKIKDLF